MAQLGRGFLVGLMRTVVSTALFIIAALGVCGHAQEKLTLTTPAARPSVVDYQVNEIRMRRSDWTIRVELAPNATAAGAATIACEWVTTTLRCNNGYTKTPAPSGFADAMAMLKALKNANNTTISMEKRVYNQLIADGAFAASVTGTPD